MLITIETKSKRVKGRDNLAVTEEKRNFAENVSNWSMTVKTKEVKKKLSKIGEWMKSSHEPVVDFSVMTEEEINSMYKAILR